jgi:aminoglycoside phosphotransferase (APT) family kinase protein
MVRDGRLTAILDWEFAGWSDPMEDLGWFCARSWRFGRFEREAGGIADRADLYAGYEEASGRRVDEARVAYWEAAAYLRWATIAVQQCRRHTSGREPSLELALTGRMLPEIEHDLLLHLDSIEEGSA